LFKQRKWVNNLKILRSGLVAGSIQINYFMLSAGLKQLRGRVVFAFQGCHFREADCVAVEKKDIYCCFVIPGLIRNPVQFQGLTFLDAGSSPA